MAKFLTSTTYSESPDGRPWRLLTGWTNEVSGDLGALSNSTDGTLTFEMPGDATQVDGYQENWKGFHIPLLTVYPDWNDATDELELLLEIGSLPMTTAKYGIWFGLIDDTYANKATADGVGMTVFPNSTTVIQTSQTGATSNASATNNGTNLNVVSHVAQRIRWTAGGVVRTVASAKRFSDDDDVTIAGTASITMGAASNRRICAGFVHVSATTGTLVMSGRIYVRRSRTSGFYHTSVPNTKPALPTNMVLLGHSIANGVGANDGVYGGVAIAGTLTVYDAGVAIATWPDANGVGPDPGVMPWWGATIGTGTIIRRAANGAILSQIETTFVHESLLDCADAGIHPNEVDLVVLMIGENDAQNGTESLAYSTRLPQTFQLVEAAYPNARVVIQNMVTEDGSYSEFASIRSTNVTTVALKAWRRLSAITDITLQDTVHYDLDGYEQAAINQLAAWTAAS